MLSGVFLAGCAGAAQTTRTVHAAITSPHGEAMAAGEADLLWWHPVGPAPTSVAFALSMLGMWFFGPMLAQCFVDWLRDRKGASR